MWAFGVTHVNHNNLRLGSGSMKCGVKPSCMASRSSTHAIRVLPWATAGLEIFTVLQPRRPSTPALGSEVEVAAHSLSSVESESFEDAPLGSSGVLFFSRPHEEVRCPMLCDCVNDLFPQAWTLAGPPYSLLIPSLLLSPLASGFLTQIVAHIPNSRHLVLPPGAAIWDCPSSCPSPPQKGSS